MTGIPDAKRVPQIYGKHLASVQGQPPPLIDPIAVTAICSVHGIQSYLVGKGTNARIVFIKNVTGKNTGPIFVKNREGELVCQLCRLNSNK